MGDKGNYICFPANANSVQGGCSIAAHAPSSSWAAGLILLCALALRVRRVRARVRR
jgi:MYXO-CTERM domain-containing protein